MVPLQTGLIWIAAVLLPSGCPGVSRSVTWLSSAPSAGPWRQDATTASGSTSPQQPIRVNDRCQPHLHTWRTPRTECCLKVKSCVWSWENSPYYYGLKEKAILVLQFWCCIVVTRNRSKSACLSASTFAVCHLLNIFGSFTSILYKYVSWLSVFKHFRTT